MDTFSLNQDVQIVATGATGKIVGVWTALNSQIQYNVRYYDNAGRAADFWFYASDLKPAQ